MARPKQYPPLLERPKCKECGGTVVRESFISYKPGKPPYKLTVYRCLRNYAGKRKTCSLQVLEKEKVELKLYHYDKSR